MRERAKTVLLCLLVLCSLILTGQLWFGQQPVEIAAENGYKPAFFEETRPLEQLILPRKIYIFWEGCCYQLPRSDSRFELFWGELSRMLQELAAPEYYHDKEGLPAEAELFISLQFAPPLPLGPESAWLKSERHGKLAGIKAWRWGDRCWVELEEAGGADRLLLLPPGWGERLASLHDQFTPGKAQSCELLGEGKLKLSSGTILTITNPVYVPAAVRGMDKLFLKPEALDRELLLNTFFINRNLVREIREKDGSLVYTDGERGLRLGKGLDYSHPRPGRKQIVTTYTAALMKAGEQISYHGGWPDDLYLESLDEQEQGRSTAGRYRVSWRSYPCGFPLIGESGVEMDYHHGLQSYRRNLHQYQRGARVKVQGYRKALEAAVATLERDGVASLTLEAMELGYFFAGAEAIPVWVIRLGGSELLLKTDDLSPPEGWKR